MRFQQVDDNKTIKVKMRLYQHTIDSPNAKSKKFLAVFDGYRFSQSTLDYAIQLTTDSNAFLVGVFLDDPLYHTYSATEVAGSGKNADHLLAQMNKKDQKKRDESVNLFQKACGQAGINYTFHRDANIALPELKQESVFADLIIISDSETFNRFEEKSPTRFIRELLGDVQCPVLIVPEKFQPIDKITMLYDGGLSSVFAIKMFSYIFNEIENIPVEVFTVKEKARGSHLPNNKLIREFIKRHFPKAKYYVTKGNAEEQILGHLRNHKENELVVLGAYRRSELSRWLKTSMADILIEELDTPLFIAHNK